MVDSMAVLVTETDVFTLWTWLLIINNVRFVGLNSIPMKS